MKEKPTFRTWLLGCATVFLFATSISAQEFKTVGYLPYYRFGNLAQIEFEKLTHVCIAFANPDMDGNLSVGGANIRPAVDAARSAGAEVLISLAGGYLEPAWAAAWKHLMKPENRAAYIHKIVQYAFDFDLAGVDVDLEWQYVDDLYSGFVIQLSDSLRARDLKMTAALPGTYRYPKINQAALDRFDFINLMAYDLTGPWNPDNAGPHSPYSFASNSIKYWKEVQGVAGNRLTLGVPFYGYDFTNRDDVTSFTYRSMVNRDPANANLDQVGMAFYNGVPTIRQKTELAMREVSGIMMWELGQDAFNEFSLLDAIWQTIRQTTQTISLTENAVELNAYPNPFFDRLQVENRSALETPFVLYNLKGNLVKQGQIAGGSSTEIDTRDLPAGFYVLRLTQTGFSSQLKLVKG